MKLLRFAMIIVINRLPPTTTWNLNWFMYCRSSLIDNAIQPNQPPLNSYSSIGWWSLPVTLRTMILVTKWSVQWQFVVEHSGEGDGRPTMTRGGSWQRFRMRVIA